MRLRAPHWILIGAVALTGLGVWLWFRNGVPIWLESAIAFCI